MGPLIGKGNTADIFDIGDNKVVKLFKAGYPLGGVLKEYENAKLLECLDLPITRSHGFIKSGNRYGIIYDRVHGESMLQLVLMTGDWENYAADLASLHKQMLAYEVPSAGSLKARLRRNIDATRDLGRKSKARLLALIDSLPAGSSLCHGDFHFDNILVSQGEYFIIDYMDICCGHKYGDIARTVYILERSAAPRDVGGRQEIAAMRKRATDIYLGHMGVSREALSEWLIVTCAARLSELDDEHSYEQKEERHAIMEYLSDVGFA